MTAELWSSHGCALMLCDINLLCRWAYCLADNACFVSCVADYFPFPLSLTVFVDIFNAPSPGAYYPERVHPQGERHAPKYSMGARTRYRKRDAVPSPNSYNLPSLLGSSVPNKQASSSYSMAGRAVTGSFAEDLAKSPGPGRYDTTDVKTYSHKAPAYSMLGRRAKHRGGGECGGRHTSMGRSDVLYSTLTWVFPHQGWWNVGFLPNPNMHVIAVNG